jgi:flagellar hook-length control protein FliK
MLPLGWQPGSSLPPAGDEVGKLLPQALISQAGQSPSELLAGLQDPALSAEAQGKLLQTGRVGLDQLGVLGSAMEHRAELRATGGFAEQYSAINLHTGSNPLASKGAVPLLTVDVAVGQPNWDKAMGERIQYMISKDIQQAEVKLTPPNLGPLEVRISLQHDQANITFLAAQAPTREALEAAIPRLREMFGEANLNLVNVDVGQRDSSGQNPPGWASGEQGHSNEALGTELSDHPQAGAVRLGVNGLVDDYA